MNVVKNALKVSVLSVSLIMSHAVLADEARGLEIAQERKARDEGWGDSVATMQMILRNAQGESSTRLMRLQSLEVDGDGDKGLTIFDEPRDVKGTAFLNHSHT
ncbi:outer membrane lipoprotein-sorting protein, partial [Vibrio parahaemolyticus]|nr:outer membrane lipoprotein-sorting protein [Vibrio parahaemolyticus]